MKIFCILSDERAFNSKSPAMFSAVMERVGIRGEYVPFKVKPQQIGHAMQSLRVLNIDGANVTIPYKESVIPHMDILSEGANIIGAVNTIVRTGEELKGYNTNAIGFMDTLEEVGFDVADKTALVFGTGGAAKAVVFILNWLRAKTITIAGRNSDNIDKVINQIAGEPVIISSLKGQSVTADIVINATSISSRDESPDFAEIVGSLDINGCELMVDLNYGREDCFWQDKAKSLETQFVDGTIPLAHSARRCFGLWTRVDVEPEEFLKAIKEAM